MRQNAWSRQVLRVLMLGIMNILWAVSSSSQISIPFEIASSPWPEQLGNHRAVIEIEKPEDAVRIKFLWRRHDRAIHETKFIVLHAETGEEVANILRVQINNELCDIVAGPMTKPGQYHFYYLPFEVMKDWGYYDKGYLKPEGRPAQSWALMVRSDLERQTPSLTKAKITAIQSRTQFDSFYPMEVISTGEEKSKFFSSTADSYLLVPESREFPIRMRDEIPLKWLTQDRQVFKGRTVRNEYFTFQIGVVAVQQRLDSLKVLSTALKDKKGNSIPSTSLTCFNTDGVDPYGQKFTTSVNVEKGFVQALWMGIDVNARVAPGTYRGTITIQPRNTVARSIVIELTVENTLLADRGDSEPWRHSRLRWLNSTLGIDEHPTAMYPALKITGNNAVECLGRRVDLTANGLPSQITSWGTPLLSAPMRWMIETPAGMESMSVKSSIERKKSDGILQREWFSESEHVTLRTTLTMEFDGYLHYRYTLTAKSDFQVQDIRLELPFTNDIAEYVMGMGLPGRTVPATHNATWKGPYDSFWIGNTYGGIHCELRGSSYHGPLLNLYKPAPPASWHNEGRGGFSLRKSDQSMLACVSSGERLLPKAQSIEFEFSLLITPVRKLDSRSQFVNRYFHGGPIEPPADDIAAGVRIVNVHHANRYNPYINYPFIATGAMKELMDRFHARGIKGKIYYTIRELTNHVTEIWALRSFGNEILSGGTGGGYPWLREHFVSDYTPQWYQHFDGEQLGVDASVLTATGESRWFNYYVEGLAWLAKNIGIDGLYLDDVSYDRRILKRMRKVLERENPSCLIDLHSNTGFSKGPATQYTEFFPYVDKLWFGESFQYDTMPPANWLVEVSGIPFGHMGDMLQGGGNRWRGMVYGMTLRLPWFTEGVTCDPRPVWKLWDQFGIADATMIGYWDRNPLVRTSHPDVLATTYKKKDRALIALASWADSSTAVQLHIDWQRLGLRPEKVTIIAPAIQDFQEAREFLHTDRITVEPKKGWLLLVQ